MKIWQRKLALALVLVMMVVCVSPAFASPALDAINQLKASGKWSNEHLNQSVIDLTYVSSGSVTTHTYMGINEDLTTQAFSVVPQENNTASNKIVRFIFTLTNQYRPETTIPVEVSQNHNTVNAYAYGEMKDEAIWAVVNGLPDVLKNAPISNTPDEQHDSDNDNSSDGGSGGSSGDNSKSINEDNDNDYSWAEKYYPENIAKTIAEFSVGNKTVTVFSDSNESETQTIEMDVSPEVIGDKLFTPVKYTAYAIGVPETGIKWDNATKTVTVTNDEITVTLTVGSIAGLVNGEPLKMDTAPYIQNSRIMAETRYIAEPLGATVNLNRSTGQLILEFPSQE